MKPGAGLWIAVGGLFVFLGCAWTALFIFAGRAKIEPVVLPSSAVHGQVR